MAVPAGVTSPGATTRRSCEQCPISVIFVASLSVMARPSGEHALVQRHSDGIIAWHASQLCRPGHQSPCPRIPQQSEHDHTGLILASSALKVTMNADPTVVIDNDDQVRPT